MNCNNKYKKLTIRSLFNSLEQMMSRSPEITLDSEIIISDINMSYLKQEIKIYPTFDYKDRQVKIGLYLNPNEKDKILQDIEELEIKETQEPKQDETPVGLSWINKYTRS